MKRYKLTRRSVIDGELKPFEYQFDAEPNSELIVRLTKLDAVEEVPEKKFEPKGK